MLPGLTDSDSELALLIDYCKKIPVEQVDLLPYHRLGVEKWHCDEETLPPREHEAAHQPITEGVQGEARGARDQGLVLSEERGRE